jgi:hypothetical protein
MEGKKHLSESKRDKITTFTTALLGYVFEIICCQKNCKGLHKVNLVKVYTVRVVVYRFCQREVQDVI